MFIKKNRGWEIPEREATPEEDFLNRRQIVMAGGLAAGALVAPSLVAPSGYGIGTAQAQEVDPTSDLYPAKRNEKYKLDRELTPEDVNGSYNNFYEFGSHKRIARAAQKLPTRPWTVTFDGMVEKETTVDIDTLIRAMPIEERLYRHRCVEAWSMTIPWSGFQMSELVKFAKPTSAAKYVRMETFNDPSFAPGQRATYQPWPYVEGLTIEEAMNELTFMATGTYGKPIAKQHGAPLRLAVPWKYGFKSIKSIVRFTFTDQRPVSFWEQLQAQEYGFWANVNPGVPHKRWSQHQERILHTGQYKNTLMFNGYGDYVANLYKDMKGERLYT